MDIFNQLQSLGLREDSDEKLKKLFRSNYILAKFYIDKVEEFSDYWPLTVRQIYYQCVNEQLVENSQNGYKKISDLGTKLRHNDFVPWEAIIDNSRRVTEKRGVSNVQEFVAEQFESFLDPRYYHRCYVQKQSNYVEVVTEKDALSNIMEEAIWPYCTRLVVAKGQMSATFKKDMADRFEQAIFNGQNPVILYFGDFDPSGVGIPKSLVESLRDEHGVEVELIRAGLNSDQIKKFNLPHYNKKYRCSSNGKAGTPYYESLWIPEYGNPKPVELDALHPKDLIQLLESELDKALDIDLMDEEIQKEREERKLLKKAQADMKLQCRKNWPELF